MQKKGSDEGNKQQPRHAELLALGIMIEEGKRKRPESSLLLW